MLEGKLSDFSLPEVFQLLALTRKSGTLNVTTREARGRIVFTDGEVSFAVADADRVAIGPRLVQAGLASREDVIAILEARRADGSNGSLSQALLDEVDVEPAVRDAFVRSSIVDAVFELMRLDDAAFAFDTMRQAEAPGAVRVATQDLVAEGERRLAEWAEIRQHIPSAEAVLVINPSAGGEGRTVTAQQWSVLALIDARRTVREIVDLSGRGEFATTRLLAEMVAEGTVEVAGEGGSALAELQARRDQLRRIQALELGTYTKTGGIARAARPDMDPNRVAPRREAPQEQPTAQAPVPQAPPQTPAPQTPAPQALAPLPQRPRPAPAVVSRPVELPDSSAPERPAVPAPASPAHALNAADTAEEGLADEDKVAPAAELIADLLDGADDEAEEARAVSAEPAAAAVRPVDRSQVARELASLGLGDDAPTRPAARPEAGDEALRRLSRDEDVNKGLLLRLIDGVKGA